MPCHLLGFELGFDTWFLFLSSSHNDHKKPQLELCAVGFDPPISHFVSANRRAETAPDFPLSLPQNQTSPSASHPLSSFPPNSPASVERKKKRKENPRILSLQPNHYQCVCLFQQRERERNKDGCTIPRRRACGFSILPKRHSLVRRQLNRYRCWSPRHNSGMYQQLGLIFMCVWSY